MKELESRFLELKSLIAEMSTQAVSMNDNAVLALMNQDVELAQRVIAQDKAIDDLDVQIDELCLTILALHDPKAIDLRYVLTASRIIIDLERIGDYCVNICDEVLKRGEESNGLQGKIRHEIPEMAQYASAMIDDAVSAFFKRNIRLAWDVIERDDQVDQLEDRILREAITDVCKHASGIQSAMQIMVVGRSLERIADHAVNIAQMAYFMVTGAIVRHTRLETIPSE